MKRLLFFSIIAFTFLALSAQSKTCVIHGRYLNKQSGEVTLDYWTNGMNKSVSSVIKNGKFVFNVIISEPSKASIDGISLWIEPHTIRVTLDAKKDNYIQVTGSETQKQQEIFDHEKQNSDEKQSDFWKKYITHHPKSYISSGLFFLLVGNEEISVNGADSIYDKLSSEVRHSREVQDAKRIIDKKRKTLPGQAAPYWEAKELSTYWINKGNKPVISLHDFKGKVILMDFWASWCTWCRKSMQAMNPIYKELKDKGFVAIAVNSDHKLYTQEWKNAIKEDSIEQWHHVNIAEIYTPAGITPKDIYYNYYIGPIPVSIVIDRHGIIRGRWTGYSEEKNKEIENTIRTLLKEKE